MPTGIYPRTPKPLSERFWNMVRKPSDPDGCWEWIGATNKGYGMIGSGGPRGAPIISAHRVSYELHHGAIPEGMHVCHTCDNRPCTNPAHLFLGTHADNMQDCLHKGRSCFAKAHKNTKLERWDIHIIREKHKEGISQTEIAKRYGLHQSTVSLIVNHKTWS
jgi:hypothetical protein